MDGSYSRSDFNHSISRLELDLNIPLHEEGVLDLNDHPKSVETLIGDNLEMHERIQDDDISFFNIPPHEEGIFDLNEYPKSNETLIDENIEMHEKIQDDDNSFLGNTFEPFIGQCFPSEEEAFMFYQNYAIHHGFSIRKGRFVTKGDEKKRRDFDCHREGSTPLKVVDPCKNQRDRASTRCGCKAHMRITLRKSFDIFPEEWHVTKYVNQHNHVLLSPSEIRYLPIKRNISESDRKRILLLKEGDLSIKQIMRVMELEQGVKHGYLPFLARDVRNLYSKIKKANSKNDVVGFLEHCKVAKQENPNFQYAYTVDQENNLEHLFWSTSSCYEWYQKYGDVVVFDTTYKVNSYDMPFGIFVGINNHGKTILFGCALLRNETTSAFSWLMKTFLHLMKKSPITILTDQDPWLTESIAEELPTTKHSFCIWHITAKFSGWFTAILRDKYSKWCDDFYKLYRLDTIEEFEHEWSRVIAMYKLHDNKHVNGLYKIKQFWVPAYLRGYFFGGMTTTGRSESINAFVKRFIGSDTCLSEFIKQVDLAIETIQNKETHDTMLDKYTISTLRTMSPLEEQARSILTPFAFKKFQEELGKASQYLVVASYGDEFIMKHFKESSIPKHKVYFHGQVSTCSCKQFEFSGILCRHILSIFFHKDCFEIPMAYLPSRWHRDVLYGKEACSTTHNSNADVHDLTIGVDNVNCPPISKTKGRPRKKRMRGGAEFEKQTKACGLCKRTGHYITTCPEKENFDQSNNYLRKKKKKTSESMGLNPIFSLKY